MKRVDNLYNNQHEKQNVICPHVESFYCIKCLYEYIPPLGTDVDYNSEDREML
jgi:hypothetical protein